MTDTLDAETAPANAPVPRWKAWFSPSRVVAIAVLGSIPVKLLSQRLSDPDLWWHLRTGRLIAETGALPHADVFSFTAYGRPWVTQEWLPELLFHYLREWFGLYGILAYRAVALFLLYLIAARLFVRRMGDGLGTWALLGLAAYAGSTNWTERPNLISFILFALTLTALDRHGRNAWWFVPIAAVWANMHGMVLIGIGTVLVVAIAESLKVRTAWEGADPAHAKRLWLVTGAGILASFLNPAGPGLLAHGLELVSIVRNLVTEWASPDFHETGMVAFLLLILLTIATLAMSKERPDPTDLALALAFTVLALQAVRNVALSSIVLGLVTARYISGAIRSLPNRPARAPDRRPGHVSVPMGLMGIAMVVIGLGAVAYRGFPRSGAIEDIVDRRYPVEAIDALKQPGVCAFVNDFWSGMVIDRDWPDVHVYIDLRQDVYGLERSRTYQRTVAAFPEWERNLDDAGVTHVLVRKTAPLAQVLALHEGWEIVHTDEGEGDEGSITFERAGWVPCSVPR